MVGLKVGLAKYRHVRMCMEFNMVGDGQIGCAAVRIDEG